jgi:flavin-dependent dehydrogenase
MGQVGDHAVVVGAGMAGLLAARVLAGAYQRVTVIERDPVPERPEVGGASPRPARACVRTWGNADPL